MAAYAALVSLINTVDAIQNRPRLFDSLDKNQIKSLLLKANFLLDFVVRYNSHRGRGEGDLESQIASAAHAAEVLIESHVVDLIHATSNPRKRKSLEHSRDQSVDDKFPLTLDLQKIIEEDLGFIAEKVEEQIGCKDLQPAQSELQPAASLRSYTPEKVSMVGFDGYQEQLSDWLTGQQSERLIIPITGMGGIGKTTLARYVYNESFIVQHFDKRAEITVSQEIDARRIILQTLSSLGEFTSELDEKSVDDLGGILHRTLFGRRYLVLLDDMWNVLAWEKVKFFFPENNNNSRIVVTTRQVEVANFFGSLSLALSFLDDDNSWKLFCEKVFGQEGCRCPPVLEGTGRKIVKKCRGLPLSIVVIGGLLGKSSREEEYWENVEKDMSSIVSSAEENLCSDILSLSYSYLPARLKPCFLYLGIFVEDHDIPVSQLIRLWVSEGFLKQNKDYSLEEVGEVYLKDLLDRNILKFCKILRYGRRYRSCKVHDLIRELCIKIAEKEKFFRVTSGCNTSRDLVRDDSGVHRVIIREEKTKSYLPQILSLSARNGTQWQKSELWRVLFDASFDSQDSSFEKVSLRYFEGMIKNCHTLPLSSLLVWNLQTLIIRQPYLGYPIVAPSEIWEMPQLRHVDVEGIGLPDPPLRDKCDPIILQNLQTLVIVDNFRCSEEICKRIPNIKKLGISYGAFYSKEAVDKTMMYYCLYNVGLFNKLESLHYQFVKVPTRDDLLQSLKFPSSLKKLTLESCQLHWDDMTMIGSLPCLEVLKLKHDSIQGLEWSPVEGEFCRLKFLEIHISGLVCWNADSSHFPVLEKLVLDCVQELQEIPSDIGEIPTLRVISMSECSVSAAISAGRILEEQDGFGNDILKVVARFSDEGTLKEVKERVEMEGFPTHNFLLSSNIFRGGTPSHVYFGSSIRGLEIHGNPEIC